MNPIRHTTLALVVFAVLALVVGCGGDSRSSTGEATDPQQTTRSESRTQEKPSQRASADVQHRADQQSSTPGRTGSQPKQHRAQDTTDDKQHGDGVVEALLDKTTDAGGQPETRVGEGARRILEEALEQGKADGGGKSDPNEGDRGSGIVDQLLQQAVKQR